jgi:glycosyltransferase involved in cell wall biosynthesis
LLSPFGTAAPPWIQDDRILRAHIIYDLIAIQHPDFFTPDAAVEVNNIIASLNEDTVIFAISEHTKRDLLAHRPALGPAQITVIPLGAGDWFRPCEDPAEMATVRKKYGIPSVAPYLLSLATLEIRKNLDQVINSFVAYLEQDELSSLNLVIAGMAGWKLDALNQTLAASSKWRNRIFLVGFVEDADLSALYSDASCFIYLSRYEGFGLPPLEAMACGTPVICANNSSLPEVVGDAGLMFDCDDVRGVAEGIGKIVSSPSYRAELSARSAERAKLFSWDRCADIVTNTLVSAQRRHARRGPRTGPKIAICDMPRQPRGAVMASQLGYVNGNAGPEFPKRFPARDDRSDSNWPTWQHRLLSPCGDIRPIEGGLRLKDLTKEGSSEKPLVSYVTVVRNNVALLERTIESVRRQTYGNVEHIILDGASTDGTLKLIEQYADQIDYFVSEPDRGLYDALNKAIPLARGQLICVLNSDDWLDPYAAEIAVRRMCGRSSPSLLFTGALIGDRQWAPTFVHPGSYFTCAVVCHNGIYATPAAYEMSGPYDTSYRIAADFKWIMTCLDAGVSSIYTRETTVHYSIGGISSDAYAHSVECIRVISERFPELSTEDVHGLYHIFFSIQSEAATLIPDRPVSANDFFQALLAKQSKNDEFIQSLAWALSGTRAWSHLGTAPVRAQAATLGLRAMCKNKLKTVLLKSPWMYKLAKRFYLSIQQRL